MNFKDVLNRIYLIFTEATFMKQKSVVCEGNYTLVDDDLNVISRGVDFLSDSMTQTSHNVIAMGTDLKLLQVRLVVHFENNQHPAKKLAMR